MAAQHAGRAGPGRGPASDPAMNGASPYGPADPEPPAWAQAWQVIMVAAVATFAIGLILLIWPKATVVVVAALIGGRCWSPASSG